MQIHTIHTDSYFTFVNNTFLLHFYSLRTYTKIKAKKKKRVFHTKKRE